MILISLEGNIGSGKENFVQFLKKVFKDNVAFLEDSIYNWNNETLLKDFYKDPERWATTLEIHSTTQKCRRLQDIINAQNPPNIILTRRTPLSDRECFVKSCVQMKYMNPKELEIYNNLFNTFKIPKYDGVIYLRSNVNKCYENIISKYTDTEKTIEFDYIQKLHVNYENWIEELKKEHVPVLEIDIEKFRNSEGNEKSQEKLLELLLVHFPLLVDFVKPHKRMEKLNENDSSEPNKWTVVKSKRTFKNVMNLI